MLNLPSVEALEQAHAFPGPYLIKVFGPPGDDFLQRSRAAATAVLGAESAVEASRRLSAQGRYSCVSLRLFVQSADQVREAYLALSRLDGVRMML